MPFFSRFKSKGLNPASKAKTGADGLHDRVGVPQKPKYQSTWNSNTVVPEEVEELIHECTREMKTRAEALDAPFLLLPFRPDSDASASRIFIRNYYKANSEGAAQYRGSSLQQELRLTESVVLCSIIKWCWSRIPGGVVTWPVYEGFQIGEREANLARHAFDTFIPITAETPARKNIIFDFFDLLAAVAAHGKTNGLGGRKLSRLAGWWAFEHSDDGKGFEGGYRSWAHAADATSHLFFAYLRSLSPEADPNMSVIERIPRSLQALLASTEYPPETPTLLQRATPRVLMLVDAVSRTPFALIRRAKHFEYRVNDRVLCEYAEYEDPIDALTEESKRVLYAVSSTNSAAARSRHRTLAKPDESWSAFQNTGFADMDEKALPNLPNGTSSSPNAAAQSLRSEPRSRNADFGRPTTPSWAEFLSSGFEESELKNGTTQLVLPPENVLPPISSRKAHQHVDEGEDLAPGELAAITSIELDDAFWWVWMTSLAGEEPAQRKAVFGRCALIETTIMNGKWLIMEEQVKGASPDQTAGVFLAPKRSFFGTLTKRGKLGRKRSAYREQPQSAPDRLNQVTSAGRSRTSLAPDQHSKIKEAAAALAKKQDGVEPESTTRRGRTDDAYSTKTNSMLTIGLQSEAGPAMKWTSAYDKNTIRAQYLGDMYAGKGLSREDILLRKTSSINVSEDASSSAAPAPPVVPPNDSSANPSLTALPLPESQQKAEPPSVPPKAQPEAVSALDKELSVDDPTSITRKPLPNTSDHPALRQSSPEAAKSAAPQTPTTPKQNPAAAAAQRAMLPSNQVTAAPSTSGPGIKKLFSRRKDTRPGTNVQNANLGGLVPPGETTRRLSVRRKKGGQFEVAPTSEIATAPTVVSDVPTQTVVPNSQDEVETALPSHVNARETIAAEKEFSQFDQGGVEDEAVPDIADEQIAAPQAQRPYNTAPVEQMTTNAEHEEPAEPTEHEDSDNDDTESEASAKDPIQASPEQDRWAAIRENAERRAARESEEHSVHSRPSQSARTDDGETSGEETIESRVARIKARVAELTGGIDSTNRR